MSDLAPLPNPNAVMQALLNAAKPDPEWYVGSAQPDNLETRTKPTLLVSTLGGPIGQLEARPAVDVTVMAPTYTAAQGAIEIIEPFVMGTRRINVPVPGMQDAWPVVIDRMDGDGFREIPLEGSRVRRFLATFQFTVRRGGTSRP